MSTRRRWFHHDGFTLIELMTVMCIIGILVGVSIVVYSRSIERAKAVEGEMAVREIDRLQATYYAQHHQYTDNLNLLGFSLSGGLKYHTLNVSVGAENNPVRYAVVATPTERQATEGWVLRRYLDGSITMDRVPVDDSSGGVLVGDPLVGSLAPSNLPVPTGPKVVQTPNSTGLPAGADGGSGAGSGTGGTGGGGPGGP